MFVLLETNCIGCYMRLLDDSWCYELMNVWIKIRGPCQGPDLSAIDKILLQKPQNSAWSQSYKLKPFRMKVSQLLQLSKIKIFFEFQKKYFTQKVSEFQSEDPDFCKSLRLRKHIVYAGKHFSEMRFLWNLKISNMRTDCIRLTLGLATAPVLRLPAHWLSCQNLNLMRSRDQYNSKV